MQHAIQNIMGAIWHLTFNVNADGSITIYRHWRDDNAKVENVVLHYQLTEVKTAKIKRMVRGAMIGPEMQYGYSVDPERATSYDVDNPRHIFDYE